jgi:ribosomal protein S18 acetylase RimI-like enzyme
MTPHIRLASATDKDIIAHFNSAMALETEGKALIPEVIGAGVAALIANPSRGFYLVAQNESLIVGCLLITFEWSDWRNGQFWWIQSVYVEPRFRGQGVYRALCKDVQQRAAQDPGVCGFRLYVEQANLRAQQTYASLGMEKTHYSIFEELKPGIVFMRQTRAFGSP